MREGGLWRLEVQNGWLGAHPRPFSHRQCKLEEAAFDIYHRLNPSDKYDVMDEIYWVKRAEGNYLTGI